MGRQTGYLFGFNAGQISEEALQRVDQAVTKVAGEVQENLLPRVLGAALMRPGSEYLFAALDNSSGRLIPFVFNTDERALIELSQGGETRFIVDDAPVSRPSVSTSISSSTFNSLSGWTDVDDAGATSSRVGSFLKLVGTGDARAGREQAVSVSGGDQGTEHGIRIRVERGPVYFSVGTSSGGVDLIAEQTLDTGVHSLAVTPTTGTMYVRLSWDGEYPALVNECSIESSGDVTIPNPWNTNAKMRAVQTAQSGDVIFCAQKDHIQRKIERRSQRSWSVVEYQPLDGPFRLENISATTIAPSATSGEVTLTASRDLFFSGHVGSVWRITHGQAFFSSTVSSADTFIGPIRVSGINESATANDRKFRIKVTPDSSFSGTVTLQRAFGIPSQWVDYESYTTDTDKEITDGRDNEIIFYRLGIKTGDISSGTVDLELEYQNQSQSGLVRITAVSSPTSASADVVSQLGDTAATKLWNEPEWSDYRGWPGAVTLFDGRLWWGGFDKVYGSVSDAFESYDDEVEGDAGPIIRSIANGPFERVVWLGALQRLIAGTAAEEVSIRASGFDEPLTPTDFTARSASQRGSAEDLPAARVDGAAIFVQRNLRRVYELLFSVEAQDYTSSDLTRLVPDICKEEVTAIAVQRQPDTRVWCVLKDGTAAVLLYERDDAAIAWVKVKMTGAFIRSVAVLPGKDEDDVYVIVSRGGQFGIEKFATLEEARGGDLTKIMDGHVVYDGSPATTITGLSHLDGEDVVVWADGEPVHDQDDMLTVSSGQITLSTAASKVCVGIPYDGKFLSARLNYGGTLGVALGRPQMVAAAHFMMKDVCPDGVKIGYDLDNLEPLPAVYNGRPLSDGEVVGSYVHDVYPMDGFSRDTRFAFECKAPYPATFLGVSLDIETGEGVEPRR